MKKALLVFTLLGLVGIGLIGCLAPTVSETTFKAHLSPSEGHPPFETTVMASKTSGTFVYDVTGHDPVSSQDNTFDTTVDSRPWECKVTWTQGEEVETVTLRPRLVNSPPVIRKPLINGAFGIWEGKPYMETRVFLDYHHGSSGRESGISDPDGDEWVLTGLEIKCDSNDGEADTLFYPSQYGYEEYHIDAGGEGCHAYDVYPAAVWYPTYIATKEAGGYPKSLTPLEGYEVDVSMVKESLRWQNATITISAEDEWGASSTETFIIPIDAHLLQTASSTAFKANI